MQFVVEGADKATGQETILVIEADSTDAAFKEAGRRGLMVSSCKAAQTPPTMTVKSSWPAWRVILIVLAVFVGLGIVEKINQNRPDNPESVSKDQAVIQSVKTSMQEKFDTDSQFKDWHLVVTDVQVISKGGNSYAGLARISYKGISHDMPVDITADGDRTIWQTSPGAFLFIAQDEMQRLQSNSP